MRFITTVLTFAAVSFTQAASAQSVAPIPSDGTVLEVTAQGTTRRVPDIATIRAGVVTQAMTATVALKENAQQMGRVIASLKAAGIAGRDVATGGLECRVERDE